jgi:hypothetical protein
LIEPAIAWRASDTIFETRSVIGISSSRMAGGMSGRTSVMRRSSVRLNIRFEDYAMHATSGVDVLACPGVAAVCASSR